MSNLKMTAAMPVVLIWMGLLLIACQPSAVPTSLPPTEAATAQATEAPSATDLPPTATVTSTSIPVIDTPTTAPTLTAAPSPTTGGSGNADVLYVRAVQADDGSWTFDVTVDHPDTGWEDYADGWDVVTPEGTVLKPDPDNPFTRLLLHPHVGEQPFTRSQGNIVIPPGVETVSVRAHDLVDGYGGRQLRIDLTTASGPDFEVQAIP